MQKKVFLSVATVLFLALQGCLAQDQLGGDQIGFTTHSMTHGGIERTYLLVRPKTYDFESIPVILALHGGGGTARSMCAMPGGIAAAAMREGFLLVCPEGFDRHWNDGRDIQNWRAHAESIDDVGFLVALVDQLSLEFPLDQGRIFATGISNGGQMSYRLACERSDRVRAIAPVVASMASTLACAPDQPISVMVINGTEDPLVPYAGGEIQAFRRGLGTVLATTKVMHFWASHNGCDTYAEPAPEPDRDPDDGTRIWRSEYSDCDEGVRVILYEVEGGGHTWPGANQYLPRFMIGRLSKDVQASEVIIEFFKNPATQTSP